MKSSTIALAITGLLSAAQAHAETLETVTVSADLRQSSEQDLPASVDVKSSAELQDQGALHFDDILLKTPNVNYSGQSSRARHIQIRGMGEREDYTGALNASVGFAIDDIDFSGIGMVGNLFDVKQVEVLRGPKNTSFGQSAIAGLINIQTNDPTDYRENMIETTLGQDQLKEFGFMTSGPVSSEKNATQYRIALFKHDSDGFRRNATLDRTDTNGRDELTIRGKFRFFPDDKTIIDLSLIHADLNNGYDAFSPYNTFTTLSGNPGKDAQLSNAASLNINWQGNPLYLLTSKTSVANSELHYSYDDDWYDYNWMVFDSKGSKRSASQEFRFTSTEASKINGNTDWLFGFYASKLDSTNVTYYWENTKNEYSIIKTATYGKLDFHPNDKTTITFGGRIENSARTFDNQDNEHFSPSEILWGANLAYSYRYNDINTAYASITRGYKAGGFNADQPIGATTPVTYSAETLYNYELGLKSRFADIGLKTDLALFYMDRYNPQFDGSFWNNNWYYYTENLDTAQNYGLEGKFDWQANSRLKLFGALGLLKTSVQGTPQNTSLVMSGREQAHAPNYQLHLGGKYRATNGLFTELEVNAVDKFYFDNINDGQSKPYTLVNARIGYEAKEYEIYLWGKNLTDERYATRGYYFDLWDGQGTQEYIRLGDPHQIGVTARIYF